MTVAPDVARDLRQRYDDGYPPRTLAAYAELPIRKIETLIRPARSGWSKALPWPERWVAECMEGEEFLFWMSGSMPPTPRIEWDYRICSDCPAEWALLARAKGTCNGSLPGETRAMRLAAGSHD